MFLLALAESIQLFPDGTLFIHVALILLMIYVLNRTFFKPINAVITSREKFKGGHNVEAEEIAATAAEKLGRYNAELLAARTKGYELIEKERAEALAARSEKVAATKSEITGTLESEREAIARQAEEARAALAKEADAMAERISATILKA